MSPVSVSRQETQIRPRPVYCVNAHWYQDRSVADAVCEGVFTCAGVTLQLGTEPDWRGAQLPVDKEWRIEWTKFYYGLDLAHAFATSGDARYLRTWEQLVASWLATVPAGTDTSDVTARRILNWLYAWDRFASADHFPGLRDGLDTDLLVGIRDQAAHIRDNLTPERNHRTFELYALFLTALALPDLDPDGELRSFAVAALHENVLDEIRPDGVHIEASTHYHMIVLRSLLGTMENARRAGLPLPPTFAERVSRACDFALHTHRPDGTIPALSDSDTASYRDLLELAGRLLARPDLTYAATGGDRGRPPSTRYASFSHGGYFTQRSGWGTGRRAFEDERHLIFDCGPLGAGGHGHYDLLSVDLAAGGRPLVVDPGRYTYSEVPAPNLRHWFKGTAAHNTVVVDGLDQTPYRRGQPGTAVATGRLLSRRSAPGLDVLHGEAVSPAYEAVHRRRVVFVADEYWLIEDVVAADDRHHYDLRFHLTPDAQGATSVTGSHDGTIVRSPGVALVIDPALTTVLEDGWISPTYGVKHAAPVVSATVARDGGLHVVTLVVPLDDGQPVPQLRVRKSAGTVEVEVDGVGDDGASRDTVVWHEQPAPGSCETAACQRRVACVRLGPGGRLTRVRVAGLATEHDNDSPVWLAWDAGDLRVRTGRRTP